MKTLHLLSLALPAVLLCGCLEVEQHPKWINGEYAGKRDNLQSQARFHGDKLTWTAKIANRNHLQNEYGRTGAGDVEAMRGEPSTKPSTVGMAGPAGAASGSPESNATRPSTASPTSAAPAQATPADNKRAPASQAKP
jgi:hypothetical protein